MTRRDIWLAVAALVLLACLPLTMAGLRALGGDFPGADDQARAAVAASHPGYQPWSAPPWQPGEVAETAIFTLQAALGATVLGYCLLRLRRRGDAADQRHARPH